MTHLPFHARASAHHPYQQLGLAIDPPRPEINFDSARLIEPPGPVPKPAVAPPGIALGVFLAQVGDLAKRINDALKPVMIAFQPVFNGYAAENRRWEAKRSTRDS